MMSRGDTDSISRRAFIAQAGVAGVGAAALAGCTEKIPDGATNANVGGICPPAQGESLSGPVSIAGSSTVYPLATAVAEKFMGIHPNVHVSVQSTGTGSGFSNFFCTGRTDFNNASRPIEEEEKQLCRKNGVGWHEMRVATDALTVIVNKKNDWVDCLTVDELRQIWKPDPAQRWSDVDPDWPDEPIRRFGPDPASGTFDYFSEVIMGEEGEHTSDYMPTKKDNLTLQSVMRSKYAIGYLGYAYYDPNKVKALAINSGTGCVKPTLETAKNGTYKPLSRPLFTYVATDSLDEDQVAAFARFYVKQSANRELVAENVGYVPNTEAMMQKQLAQLNDVIESVQ